MDRLTVSLVRVVVVCAVLALLVAGCSRRDLPELDVASAGAGATPPSATLVDGGWAEVAAFVDASAAQGKGTVVNLFASWCAPCERELPLLLATSATTPDVRWIGVASQDRREAAEAFVERLDVTWPSVLDPPAEVHTALEGVAMPTTAFFDAEGVLREIVVGELDEDELEAALATIR